MTPPAVQSWMIRHGSMRAKPRELSLDSASTSDFSGVGRFGLQDAWDKWHWTIYEKHQFFAPKMAKIICVRTHQINEVFAIKSCRIHVLFAHLMSPTLSWHPPKRKLTICENVCVWTSYSMFKFAVPKGSPKSSLKKRENILHYSGEPKIRVHMQLASFT